MARAFNILVCLLLAISSWHSVYAQKPFWTDGYFHDAKYSYIEVTSATGWEVADARKKAYQEIINRRSIATGTNAQVHIQQETLTVESSHDLIVKSRIVDEYIEQLEPGLYKVYLLVQTAKNPTFEYENVLISDKYPFSARVLVPGWAQIYKGSKVKGGLIIAGEVIGVGGIVLSYSMKSSYDRLIQQDPKHAKTYAQYADMWQNIAYGAIAFTAAIYVYNLIDGSVARGKKRIFINNDLAFSPVYMPQSNTIGLAMKMNF